MCVCVCVGMYAHTYVCKQKHVYSHIINAAFMFVFTSASVHAVRFISLLIYMHAILYIYIYIYTDKKNTCRQKKRERL